MISLPNSWLELLQSITGMVGRTRAEQLFILGVVAAPCILALLSRSIIALAVAALLLASSITAFQARPDVLHQWSIALAAFAAGCLTCLQAIRLRSSRRRMRRAEEERADAQHELEAVREQLQREVYWRTASEAHKPNRPSRP
jgi:sensor domain CHASE-containing protein